jgi:diguanylate cyclase (GGDEF)-like protein
MKSEALSDVLREFARTMVTDFPIQGILDHLVRRIVEIMPVTAAGVTLISAGLDPRYVAASNGSALLFEQLQSELGEGPCLAAYHTGQAISVPDLRAELQRFPNFSPAALEAGLIAVFTFPLRHGDVQLGALDLYRDLAGPLSPDAFRAAQTLADVAAAYLINAQARADLQDATDQSREAALHDPLTGLPNRALMLERLDHAFLRGRRSGKTSAVFFVDLDDFKTVNDTFGHRVGDELLVAVAERLTGVLRPGDTLARLSGDEFVILCEELDSPSQADVIAARSHAAMTEPFVLAGGEVVITASIGIAFTGRGADAPEQLIHDADVAMYRTKHHGRGGQEILDLRRLHLAEHQAGVARALPGAAERGELHLVYQPIVTTTHGHMTGVEALLRWTHPSRGAVPSSVFIPVAEQSGRIVEIGRWVLEQACRDRHRWQTQRSDELAMSVNVSVHQFMSAGFVDTVASALATGSTDPSLLTLEVTESVFVRDGERARIVLGELKSIGVKLALDDFGTGYSSLNRLMRLPIDTVKLERSFIADLRDEPAGHPVVTAIIQLAHGLGMTVIAEGVETAEQHRTLAELGCDFCQGYYFARPMTATSIGALIEHRSDRINPILPTLNTDTAGPAARDR